MARKPQQKVENDDRTKLLEALRFVAFVSQGHENEDFKYIRISNGLLVAADNVICIGSNVDSALDICLHGDKLRAGLEQCGANFQFTQLDNKSVSIRSEKFRAIVPARPSDMMTAHMPDAPVAEINNNLLTAFELCGALVPGKGDRPYSNSLRLGPQSCVGSNGAMILEYWHGIDLPDGLLIPKRALQAIVKAKKPLAKFGFSKVSATFYFDDGTFVKTRLEDAIYPDVQKVFNQFHGVNYRDLPADFYKALDAIESFVVNDTVYFQTDCISTDVSLESGASYSVDGIIGLTAYNPKLWKIAQGLIKGVYFGKPAQPSIWYGDNVRGAIGSKHVG